MLVNYWDKYTEMHGQQNIKNRYVLSYRNTWTHDTKLLRHSVWDVNVDLTLK